MSNREKIQNRLAEIESERAELLAEQERLLNLSEDRRLAEELHSMRCRLAHEDQCGWYYEIHKGVHDWSNGWAHGQYLEMADKVMNLLPDMSVDDILKVAKALR